MDEMLELKKLVIEELARQIEKEDRTKLAKEYEMTEEKLNSLIKKILNKWLRHQDQVLLIAMTLGISAPRQDEGKAHYIG